MCEARVSFTRRSFATEWSGLPNVSGFGSAGRAVERSKVRVCLKPMLCSQLGICPVLRLATPVSTATSSFSSYTAVQASPLVPAVSRPHQQHTAEGGLLFVVVR